MVTDSFIFYRSFYDAINDVPEEERLIIYEAIFALVFDKKDPDLIGMPATLMKLMKPVIEASVANRLNGGKGGRPKKERGVIENKKGGFSENNNRALEKAETNGNVNVNVNVNDNEDFIGENFNGQTAEPKITKEWENELGVMLFSEKEKMAIFELNKNGCLAIDAKNARLENPKYFGKLSGDHTRRLIVTQKDLRLSKSKGNGLAFAF